MLIVDLTTNQVMTHRSPTPETIADADWVQHMKRNGVRGLGRLLRSVEPTHFSMPRSVNFAEIGIELETECLVEPFIVDGLVLGGMILFTGERQLDPFDALVAEEARFTLAVLLMRAHVRFSAQAETHGEFFGRLFSGNWRDRTETLARAGHLGIPLDQPARLAILAVADGSGKRPSETVDADVQRALQRIAGRQQPGATAFAEGGAFVVFLPESSGAEKAMRRTVQRLLDEVEWITGGRPFATIGRPCRSLEDYRTARQDGARLLDLARRLDRRGLVTEEDIGPFARLLAAADQSALRSFIADILGPIEAYDDKHGSGFLETLDVFLSQSCRYSAAAVALGIHITTLRYRLRRLEELFRIDFSNAEARLALEVALRLRTVVGPEA
jgi:purine catabolism regulator